MNGSQTAAPARGRPPKAEGRSTRTRILDAALDGFATYGYAGTSIRLIARAVGIRESAIYSHFAGKKAILDALLAEAGPAVVVNLLETVEPSDEPETTIRRLIEAAMDRWDEPRARRFLSVSLRAGGPGAPIFGDALTGEIQRARQLFGRLIGTWAAAGYFRRDVSPDQLAWQLMAPIALIRLMHFVTDSSESTRQAGRRLVAQHLDFFFTCMTVKGAQR